MSLNSKYELDKAILLHRRIQELQYNCAMLRKPLDANRRALQAKKREWENLPADLRTTVEGQLKIQGINT